MEPVEIIVDCDYLPGLNLEDFELAHTDRLRRAGIPMISRFLFQGVEFGELGWEDFPNLSIRTYTWYHPGKGRINPPSTWFKRKYNIHRSTNLGEVWYQVSEWNWYWPFWTKWTHACFDCIYITLFQSLHEAREAIRYRQSKAKSITSTVVERL